MAINFTSDGSTDDLTMGGGINATNWSKTFTDYKRSSGMGAEYHASGTIHGPTLDMPFGYTIQVLPRSDPGTGNYDSDGANRYYPVSFRSGTVRRASSRPNLIIMRHYAHSGPYQFESANSVDIGWTGGSSSHQGGLYASYIVGDSAWSDMYEAQVTRVRQTYHTTIADHGMQLSYSVDRGAGPFWVMLRGGFTYYVYASYSAMPTQVTAGGSCFSYGGNDQFRTWPASTTTLITKTGIQGDDGLGNGFTYGSTLVGMG